MCKWSVLTVIMINHESLFREFCEKYPNVLKNNFIHTSWYPILNIAFVENLEKLEQLNFFLGSISQPVNPAPEHVWAFTRFCLPSQVKVVIMGQDPYHSPNLRNVLGFSVNRPENEIPPSLENILKEVEEDIKDSRYASTLTGYPPQHGCLESWAIQGVLFLDTALTVSQGCARSHAQQGWEEIVGSILRGLQRHNLNNEGVSVFMLWGNAAKMMKSFLFPLNTNLILEAGHPSPSNENYDFRGCKHFSKANDFLVAAGKYPIDWSLKAE